MRFALGPLRVTIKYTFTKDGSTYYQRAVPTDLRDRYPGKTVKVHLKTTDPFTVARMVEKLNRKFEAEWAGLRASPDSTPDASKAHARDYLRRWGLEPMSTDNPPAALELLRQHWDDKRAEFAGGDDRAYREAHPTDYLSDTERAAWKALYTAPKPTIADLRDLYLSSHVKRDEAGFRKLTNIAFDGLMGAVGTKDIESFTRADVRAYVEAEIPVPRVSTSPSSPSAPASTLGVLPVDWWESGRGWKHGKTEARGFSECGSDESWMRPRGVAGGAIAPSIPQVGSRIFVPELFCPAEHRIETLSVLG